MIKNNQTKENQDKWVLKIKKTKFLSLEFLEEIERFSKASISFWLLCFGFLTWDRMETTIPSKRELWNAAQQCTHRSEPMPARTSLTSLTSHLQSEMFLWPSSSPISINCVSQILRDNKRSLGPQFTQVPKFKGSPGTFVFNLRLQSAKIHRPAEAGWDPCNHLV